ncbi:MAG: elongation factor G [Pirellulales bacterium]|nr:elongation factor G [Pirellulales bacterium]
MPKLEMSNIRNIALCGHGHSGKSTLADKLLVVTGAINKAASVDDGTSICDFDAIEKEHHYSIESHIVHFDYQGVRFNVIDTPGYPDFIGQTIAALHAVETAIIVINAHAGIEVNTRRVFAEAGKIGLGRIILIDKMDADNVDFERLVAEIQDVFGKQCLPLEVPVGQGQGFKGVIDTLHPPANSAGAIVDPNSINTPLIETIIEVDEETTAHYFDGIPPTDEELSRDILQSIREGHLIPILEVSGKTGVGVQELLDELLLCTLPPDAIPRTALDENGTEVPLAEDPAGPLVAQVFKTRIDPYVQKLSYLRIYNGTLKKEDSVHISGGRKNIKITQILEVQGSEHKPVDSAGPGEIVALAKQEDLHTNTTLGPWTMAPIKFPTPMVGVAAAPRNRADEAKLSGALHKLTEEDSTLTIDRDPQTKEMVIHGMSELHLSVVRERLQKRDKVEIDTHEPKIPYRETIQIKAEGNYRHKKQSGGRGQFGEVHFRMFPLPLGAKPEEFCTKERFPHLREHRYHPELNFLFVDSIVGGSIPNNFLPAIEKGCLERIERGVIAGQPVRNICIEVHFGKYHDVDSSEAAFKIAAAMCFKNTFLTAKPSLLEPIVTLTVTVPNDKIGDISSDLSTRRGRVLGMDAAGGGLQSVSALVPLAEITTYARSLSSITGGAGSYSLEFSHYDVVPPNIQKQIMEAAVVHPDEEE